MIQEPGIQHKDIPLRRYRAEVQDELYNILRYWQQFTVDEAQGGFYGALDNENRVKAGSPKGGVLNARILWTFAAAYNLDGQTQWLQLAQRAYNYLQQYFLDKEQGGVYWSVQANGQPLDTRKQVYGQAFAIYALGEYYKCTGSSAALESAIALYRLLERYSYDPRHKGYYDAFSRSWEPEHATALGGGLAGTAKTMNTHLHVLEAYTCLYQVWPDAGLRTQLYYLIKVFIEHIIDPATHHQLLFFEADWKPQSRVISYGHDIEAAWLLAEAAERLGDSELTEQVHRASLALAAVTPEGLDAGGGLRYEYDPATGHANAQKDWWVQAEAMVGFLNAYQLGGDKRYLQHSLQSWEFIKAHLLNRQHGEWYWGVTAAGRVVQGHDKAGFWKCPYHNSRACMEVIKRIDSLT